MSEEICIHCGKKFNPDNQSPYKDFDCSYHLLDPIQIGNTGALGDYNEIWVFPCCNKAYVTVDGKPPKSPGCVNGFHVSKKSTIFISYARADVEFVTFLSNELKRRGYTIWRDMENILIGDNWKDEINLAINTCSHFLFVLSKEAVLRPEVNREISVALLANKKIIPIILGDISLFKIPTQLINYNFIKWEKKVSRFAYCRYDDNFKKLDEALDDPNRLRFLNRIKSGR